jgi:hypothetical protein
MPPLRRYAPFLVVVTVQLALATLTPSRPVQQAGADAPLPLPLVQGGVSVAPKSGSGPQAPGAGSSSAVPGTTAPGTTSSGSSAGQRPSSVGTSGTSSTPAGEATVAPHCVSGLLNPPPCIAGWAGGSNNGATSPGVTGSTITVLMYHSKENPASSAIAKQVGVYMSPAEDQAYLKAAGAFINSRYELYGRKLNLVHVVGQCDIAPPQESCFRSEADSLVAQYKPFAVFWVNNMNETAFFDEMSRKGVINWGGWNFSDQFSKGLRPYHWDSLMGGDRQAEIAAEYWCKRMAGRPAQFAGSEFTTKTRKVAILTADTPATAPNGRHLLSLLQKCDHNSPELQLYSSNTSTAASQSTSTMAKLHSDGVTSVLWFSDPIAPVYATAQMTAQGYFPEHVLVGSGLLDYDALGQAYDQQQWVHAFGLSDVAAAMPTAQSDAGRVWVAGGGGSADGLSDYSNVVWAYLSLVATGLQQAGPTLTPLTFERGLLSMQGFGSWQQKHDPRLYFTKFGPNDYTGISDVRQVYWDPNAISAVNGKNGAYVALDQGRRYQTGELPSSAMTLPGRG